MTTMKIHTNIGILVKSHDKYLGNRSKFLENIEKYMNLPIGFLQVALNYSTIGRH